MGMKVVVGGTLIKGTDADPIENTIIVIENERIKEVGQKTEVSIPPDAMTIDAVGKTIIPGLVEAHVHLWGVVTMNPHN